MIAVGMDAFVAALSQDAFASWLFVLASLFCLVVCLWLFFGRPRRQDVMRCSDEAQCPSAENAAAASDPFPLPNIDMRRLQHLEAILDSLDAAVIVANRDGRITQLNRVAERMTGYVGKDALGQPCASVIHLHTMDALVPVPDPATHAGPNNAQLPDKLVLLDREGARHLVCAHVAPFLDPEGHRDGTLLVLRDIAQRLVHEERLVQTRKMESIAQLAGGIAHDFNNLLAGVMGYAELIQEKAEHDSSIARHAAQIISITERASSLTGQLLSFSRKGKFLASLFDVHAVIAGMLALLRRNLPAGIEIETAFGATRASVRGDCIQFQNALLNLGINAIEAMPDGGTLSITTDTLTLQSGDCRNEKADLSPGMYLRLRLGDTGVGMSDAVRARLFEPFFTTKHPGHGTGLSLAAVYGCVAAHHGCITAASTPEKGTVFTILLPLAADGVASVPLSSSPCAAGKKTVLLVDDEAIIREIASTLLETLGYVVVLAEHGRAAVEIARERKDDLAAIILDIIMPEMDGSEAFPLLREICPTVPVLIASGFSKNERVQNLLDQGAAGFLKKPYRKEHLAEMLAGIGC